MTTATVITTTEFPLMPDRGAKVRNPNAFRA